MEVPRRRKLMVGVVVGTIVLVAYAWIDGGRQPLHTITQDLDVPEANR